MGESQSLGCHGDMPFSKGISLLKLSLTSMLAARLQSIIDPIDMKICVNTGASGTKKELKKKPLDAAY